MELRADVVEIRVKSLFAPDNPGLEGNLLGGHGGHGQYHAAVQDFIHLHGIFAAQSHPGGRQVHHASDEFLSLVAVNFKIK
jgi:hypothetical protein